MVTNRDMHKSLLIRLVWSLCIAFAVNARAHASDYRLGVVIVVDQFRADYLMRFKDDLEKAGSTSGGYRFLMEKGAYFPLADHGLFQNMTGPGHAAILTGSYPYRNQISMNFWFDRSRSKVQYCAQDDESKQIGSDGIVANAKFGISARNLNADTVGDELKNVDRPTRVVSIATKDRAAVFLGGKRSDYTLWLDEQNCQWVSSQYYLKELPPFAKKANEHLQSIKNEKVDFSSFKGITACSPNWMRSPWPIQETFDLALKSVDALGLGKGKDTDLLLLSLSAHDYLGHLLGPNDPAMKEMVLAEDRKIAAFLKALSQKVPGGLKDVFVVLTGDHGIPPSTKAIPQERMVSKNLDPKVMEKLIEDTLSDSYGKPKGGKWVDFLFDAQAYLSGEALQSAKITSIQAAEVLRKRFLKEDYVAEVYARDSILIDRKVPAGELGVVLDRTLSKNSGDVIISLKPFYFVDPGANMSHMTMYSYDRYVPLVFWGKTFKPGEYRQNVRIVDIAPTLSSVLHVLPPSQSEGRVITEILR